MRQFRFFPGIVAALLPLAPWLLLAGAPLAQTTVNTACGPDLWKYCAGVQPGQGRLVQCLQARSTDLSEGCKTFLAQARGCAPEAGYVVECIKPSDTDPAITRYNRLNYVSRRDDTGPRANLLVFLTGTGGEPPGPLVFSACSRRCGLPGHFARL
jgi:hypothetical protein